MYNLENTLLKLANLELTGNIVPHVWYKKITFENSKPDLLGILFLSEIVYWYRPVILKDEATGKILGYKKKFKADMLQRSIQSFADQFGISPRQASDTLGRLVKSGLIYRELRTINTSMGKIGNVLHVAPVVEKIQELQSDIALLTAETAAIANDVIPLRNQLREGGQTNHRYPSCNQIREVTQQDVDGHVIDRVTYTETTTKTTAEKAAANDKSRIKGGNSKTSWTAAAFSSLQEEDAVIKERLTQNQAEAIKLVAQDLSTHGLVVNLNQLSFIMLDKNKYKQTNNEFLKKLNTIKKELRAGKLNLNVEKIPEPVHQHASEITALEDKLRQLNREYQGILAYQERMQRFGNADAVAKTGKEISDVKQAIEEVKNQLNELRSEPLSLIA